MVPNAAVVNQAEQSRIDGNHYFKKNRFGAAIDAYTQAITLCPNVPVYYTNRALCHLKRNDWERVEEDCRRAIKLDSNTVKVSKEILHQIINFLGYGIGFLKRYPELGIKTPAVLEYLAKAHYMLGLALIQKQEYPKGIRELEKALDLGRGAKPKGYMVEEIWQELAKAKYLEWERTSTKRSWDLQSLKEACESALKEKHFLEASETEGFVDDAAISHLKQLEALEVVFNKAGEDDKPAEVPDYLCCRITLDIFHDPVITPSGLTYERAVILDHLQKVGKFDPVTREPLDSSQLVPNLAIKEAVHAFLDKHGWAYKIE